MLFFAGIKRRLMNIFRKSCCYVCLFCIFHWNWNSKIVLDVKDAVLIRDCFVTLICVKNTLIVDVLSVHHVGHICNLQATCNSFPFFLGIQSFPVLVMILIHYQFNAYCVIIVFAESYRL